MVTDSLGCKDSLAIQVLQATGINLQSSVLNFQLKVYPNPNNGNFQINYKLPEKQHGELIIFDLMGRELFTYYLEGGINIKIISES